VTYNGTPASPPFPPNSGYVNPTINPPLGTQIGENNGISDKNLPPNGSFKKPYSASTFSGTQQFRYNCPCQGTPNYTSFSGYSGVSIQRQVQQSGATWQYVVSKQGYQCTLTLP
jgi:hypothetical protein